MSDNNCSSPDRASIEKPDLPATSPDNPLDVAVVGGGLAGLYCIYQLRRWSAANAALFEASDHLGGRIWSARYEDGYKNSDTFKDSNQDPEFCAEFGPMRVELDHQVLLHDLLLGNKSRRLPDGEEDRGLGFDERDLAPFAPYKSPIATHEAKYELSPSEAKEATPLNLLRLGIIRILGLLVVPEREEDPRCDSKGESTKGDWSREELERAATLENHLSDLSRRLVTWPEDSAQAFTKWARLLNEHDYQNIREFGRFDDGSPGGTPLWRMGFWNLLSEVLSHPAVLKIRDVGTFYHLLPDNPNAAEWLIFWLRAFKASDSLVGIRGGMQRIAVRLQDESSNKAAATRLFWTNCRVISLARTSGNGDREVVVLTLRHEKVWDEGGKTRTELMEDAKVYARHVILALPTSPLDKLSDCFADIRGKSFHFWMDAAFGFPLLKLFLIVKKKWWKDEDDSLQTNLYATRFPAREVHYKSPRRRSDSPKDKANEKGMILLYTDRPASSFWANYVKEAGRQERPEWGPPHDNPRLVNRMVRYINELAREYSSEHAKSSRLETFGSKDVDSYGIRDWGREPYGGACHAWRPERRSWEVLEALSAASLKNSTASNVHICGEAYSDYHGFMEGSLRSAAHVLHVIAARLERALPSRFQANLFPTETPWLCSCGTCKKNWKGRRFEGGAETV